MAPPLYIERSFASVDELCKVLADDYWQRRPVVFRNHGLGPLFGTADDVLDGLRTLNSLGVAPRVYVDGHWAPTKAAHFCDEADASPRAFVERLDREYAARELLVVTDSFERASERIWFSSARFCEALYSTVGFPVGEAQVNVFAGSYSRTPFNFHKDVADSLSYALVGHKRYLIWDFETVAAHLKLPSDARHENVRFDAFDHRRLLSHATVLETQPGDLFYWPWDCFHLAEPRDAAYSLTISFGIAPFAAPFAGAEALTKQRAYSMRAEPFSGGEQADLMRGEIDALLAAARDEVLLDEMSKRRLFRRTRFGFKHSLPLGPDASFELEDVIVPHLPNLVAWTRRSGRLTASVNGHGFSVEDHRGLVALFETLNRGEPISFAELRRAIGTDDRLDGEDLQEILGCLLRFRAFARRSAQAVPSIRRAGRVPREIFQKSGLFPVRFVDDGRSLLLAAISDEDHGSLEGRPTKAVRLSLDELSDVYAHYPPCTTLQPRYVFTAGYSGSTLLGRAIDAIPECYTIYEPSVLGEWALRYGALVDAGDQARWRATLRLIEALLFRGRTSERRMVVKVGAHVMDVMPELMTPRTRGLHLYTTLPTFLGSILKDDKRRADLRVGAMAPQRRRIVERLGAEPVDCDTLSDACAAAYVWLTDRLLYGWLRSHGHEIRLRSLDFDRLLEHPSDGLRAVSIHLDLGLPPDGEDAIVNGEVFRHHAKNGARRRFDRQARLASIDAEQQAHRAEIEEALAWVQGFVPGPLAPRFAGGLFDVEPIAVGQAC